VIYGLQTLELPNGGTSNQSVAVGYSVLNLAPSGFFTGTILVKGRVRRFAGVLDGSGTRELTVPLDAFDSATVTVQLDLLSTVPKIAMDIIDPEDFLNADLGKLATAPAFSRQYTAGFLPDSVNTLFAGAGYAAITHAGRGVFRMAGAAPSGERFSAVAYFDGEIANAAGAPADATASGGTGSASFFVFLPGGGGLISSNRSFGGSIDFGFGTVPFVGGVARSQTGVFGDDLEVIGALYTPPTLRAPVPAPLVASTTESYRFVADFPDSTGAFGTPIVDRGFRVTPGARPFVPTPGQDRLALGINPQSGVFFGQVFNPANERKIVGGVLLQGNGTENLGLGAAGEFRVRLLPPTPVE
jgi:hypothetical protein